MALSVGRSPLLATALLMGGCAWEMEMPCEQPLTRLQDASEGSQGAIRKAVLLDISKSRANSWGYRYQVQGTYLIANRDAGYRNGSVGVWNLRTGAMVVEVDPPSPLPEEVRDYPAGVAFDPERRLLATCRDEVLQIWRTDTRSVLREIPFGGTPIVEKVEYVRAKPAYTHRSAETPIEGRFSPDGRALTVTLWSQGTVTWDIGSGTVIGRVPARSKLVDPDHVARCDEYVFEKDGRLIRPDGTSSPLAGLHNPLSSGVTAFFSPGCRYVVGLFFAGPYKLDPTPDHTTPHYRAWDAATGLFITWFKQSELDFVGFVDDSTVALRHHEPDWSTSLVWASLEEHRELARVRIGRAPLIEQLPDRRSFLVLDDTEPAVWTIDSANEPRHE